MATWVKIKLFWQTLLGSTGSTLTATSTASGYDVKNIYNMLEVNSWKAANGSVPMYLDYDAVTAARQADYLAVLGHNLKTLNAMVALQGSTDGTTYRSLIAVLPTADNVFLEELRLVCNERFDVWSSGVSSPPDGWSKNGTGATVARGTITDSSVQYSADLTYGSAVAWLQHTLEYLTDVTAYRGKTVTLGCLVFATATSVGRLAIRDAQGADSYSSFHTGSGAWEWLTVTRTIASNATTVQWRLRVEAAGTVRFALPIVVVGSSVASTDRPSLIEGGSTAYRYWRFKIAEKDGGAALSPVPYLSVCIWGNKTELDYASASFDPHGQDIKATAVISQGGYITGIYRTHTERRVEFAIDDADAALYAKVKDWIDTHGPNQLFVAWETANSPDEVFLMRPDLSIRNPLVIGGARRDIRMAFTGRKE